jgi:hypothetical protein
MTADSQGLRDQLVATATTYRHLHEEHRRARRGGRTRRHLGARLGELSTHLERLLADPTLDEAVRAAWRRRVYHGGVEPDVPTALPASPSAVRRPPRNRARGSGPLWQR